MLLITILCIFGPRLHNFPSSPSTRVLGDPLVRTHSSGHTHTRARARTGRPLRTTTRAKNRSSQQETAAFAKKCTSTASLARQRSSRSAKSNASRASPSSNHSSSRLSKELAGWESTSRRPKRRETKRAPSQANKWPHVFTPSLLR